MSLKARIFLAVSIASIPLLGAVVLGLVTQDMKLAFNIAGTATLVVLPLAALGTAVMWPAQYTRLSDDDDWFDDEPPLTEMPAAATQEAVARLRKDLETVSATTEQEERARDIMESAVLHARRTSAAPR